MENKEKLGEILFLQLDNCFRENKNKFLLSFASLLVDLEVFKEVSHSVVCTDPSPLFNWYS